GRPDGTRPTRPGVGRVRAGDGGTQGLGPAAVLRFPARREAPRRRSVAGAAATGAAPAAAEDSLACGSRGAVRQGRARGRRRPARGGALAGAARTALRLGTAGDRAGFAAARRRAARCTAADGDRQGLATTHGADLDPRARGAVAVAGSSAGRRALSVPLPR